MDLVKLNHRHTALVNWLMLNPDKTLVEAASALNYTPEYVRMVVGSDMFQAVYRERCLELESAVTHTVIGQLKGTAFLAVEKLNDRLQKPHSEKFLVDASNTVFKALGFGAPGVGVQLHQHQHLHLTPEDMAEARRAAAQHFAGTSSVQLVTEQPEEADVVAA